MRIPRHWHAHRNALVVCLLALVVTGCGGSNASSIQSSSNTTTEETSSSTEITNTASDDNSEEQEQSPSMPEQASETAGDEKANEFKSHSTTGTYSRGGTRTIEVYNPSSGNTYSLDADVSNGEVERLYFPNGGSVELTSGDIDASGNGDGIDVQGRSWEFQGWDDGATSSAIDDEDAGKDASMNDGESGEE